MITVAFHNLGCKVNAYEADRMRKSLLDEGFLLVPFEEKADVYIINTCTVTNIADRKTRQMIHRARGMNKDAIVVAAGCYVDIRGREQLLSDGTDVAVFNQDKTRIAEIIRHALWERDLLVKEEEPAASPVPHSDPYAHTRAWIKCQDGCNMFCSYCIIPHARGRITSRRISDILEEARDLSEEGYRELVLTGIHLSSYGLDRPDEGESLLQLIRAAAGIDGIQRIRLGSLEPGIITEEFAGSLKEIPKLCPHFHLSLQSGCDTVLKRMNRRYTTEEYAESVAILRKFFSHPAITTDIIVGFPGESEEEFEKTVSFVEKIGFYETHIFKYSRRRGTAADRMEGQLPDSVKTKRSRVLLNLRERDKRNYMETIPKGERLELLLEEPVQIEGKEHLAGYTREYIRAAVPLLGYKSGDLVTGLPLKGPGDILLLTDIHPGCRS